MQQPPPPQQPIIAAKLLQDTGWCRSLLSESSALAKCSRLRYAAEMDADFLLPKQGLAALAIDGTPDPESVAYRAQKLSTRHRQVCVFVAMTNPSAWQMNPPAVATAAAPSADVDRLNFIWSIQESLLKLHLTKTQVLPVNSGAEWTNALHILAKTGDPVARQTVCERLSQASGVIRTSRFLSDCERITESIMVSKHRLPAHDCLVLQELPSVRSLVSATITDLQECSLDRSTCELVVSFFEEDRRLT